MMKSRIIKSTERMLSMKKSILSGLYNQECQFDDGIVKTFTNVEEEYEAVRQHVGLMDFSNYGIIKITGEDAMTLLQNLTTRDFEYLAPEKARTAFMLDEKANIISLVHVFNLETYYYLITDPQHYEVTLDWLNSHSEGNVNIEGRTEKDVVIGIEGPDSWKVIEQYLPVEVSAFSFMSITEIEYNSQTVVLSRFGFTGEYGYIMIAPESIGKVLWTELLDKGMEYDIKLCGNDALECCMLEVRQPDINVESIKDMTIFDSRLQWLIDFTKEDYIGYEAVQELMEQSTKYGIIGFESEAISEAGNEVSIENEVIGKVLSCYYSAVLNKNLGLALLRDEYIAVGLQLSVKNKEEIIDISTVSNPYIIPKSWVVKMI